MTRLRTDLFGIVESAGGAMTVSELAEALVVTRGCVEEEPLRTRLARSVVRAAVEVERSMGEPRFQVRRDGDRVLVALSQDLAGYAFRLGDLADKLAAEDPLVPPQRVLQRLREVSPPERCSRAHGFSVGPAGGGGFLSGRSLQPAGTLSHGDGCGPRHQALSGGALWCRVTDGSGSPRAGPEPLSGGGPSTGPAGARYVAARGGVRVPVEPDAEGCWGLRESAPGFDLGVESERVRGASADGDGSRSRDWRSPPRSPTPASSRNGSGTASRKGPSTRCS